MHFWYKETLLLTECGWPAGWVGGLEAGGLAGLVGGLVGWLGWLVGWLGWLVLVIGFDNIPNIRLVD